MSNSLNEGIKIQTPDGFILNGAFVTAPSPKSIVIMCHGIASHKEEYLDMFPFIANELFSKNISSLRFDFRGHGGSSGSTTDFNIIGQIIDLDSVIKWIRGKPGYSTVSISFLGVSFGAAPGIFWSTTRQLFHKTCFFAPVLSYKETFLEPVTAWGIKNFNKEALQLAEKNGYLLLDDEFKISVALLEQMRQLDPLNALGHVKEFFLVHGSADSLVPVSVSKSVANSHKSSCVKIVDKMDHGLFIVGDDDCKSDASRALFNDVSSQIVDYFND